MTIRIYFDQIPEHPEMNPQNYPEHTVFILDDRRPERDPVTFQLIHPPRRTKIYPEDIVKAQKGDKIPIHRFVSLLRNGNKLLCPICRKGRMKTDYNPEISHHFYCDRCKENLFID